MPQHAAPAKAPARKARGMSLENGRFGHGREAVLLAGGTDPCGGAGLAADIKAVSAAGAHACIAVTAVTVQDSGAVYSWEGVDPALFEAQALAAAGDARIEAVKSGMLGSPGIAEALSRLLSGPLSGVPYVMDPVLVAGSGDSLSSGGMVSAALSLLLPRCALCTPNLDEASAMAGFPVSSREGMEKAGRTLCGLGAPAVLVKGGHLEGRPADVLVAGGAVRWFEGTRIVPGKVHGTGCTLASAIAARLAQGHGVEQAVEMGLRYLRKALSSSFPMRGGTILGHFPARGPRPGERNEDSFYDAPAFCPGCGSALEGEMPPDGHLNCPACGEVVWRNPLPAVTVVVRRGAEVLLVRRSIQPRKGMFCLPGGFLELGETVEECARRELREETGLSAGRLSLLGVTTDSTEYGGIALVAFETGETRGVELPGDDASETAWFRLDGLPPLAFEAHSRLLAGIAARRPGGA